jgi:thiamine-phosphate pyrophosphorylase
MGPEQPRTGQTRRAKLQTARLYLICDSRPRGRDLLELLRASIAGGVDIVQLRDKRLSDDELLPFARAAATLCRQLGALFVVNDRPAVALAAGADGAHVGQDDMPVAQVRALVGPDVLIGLSTHSPQEIDALDDTHRGNDDVEHDTSVTVRDTDRAVDYIGVGPIYVTPTKPGRPATGLELVHYAAAHALVPCFAIGGIHAGNAHAVRRAGATRIAVVRALLDARDPAAAARRLRRELDPPVT